MHFVWRSYISNIISEYYYGNIILYLNILSLKGTLKVIDPLTFLDNG